MEHFVELIKEELINFILVYCLEEKKSKLPKKGKLEAAKNGEHNLIKIAFENQYKINMLAEEHASILSTEDHPQEATPQPSRQLISHTILISITAKYENVRI
eukprot:15366720-Ditylum_brightwellii.AAC.2